VFRYRRLAIDTILHSLVMARSFAFSFEEVVRQNRKVSTLEHVSIPTGFTVIDHPGPGAEAARQRNNGQHCVRVHSVGGKETRS